MNVEIIIKKFDTTPEPGMVVTARGYGDPVMIEWEGLDVADTGDNFNHCDYWTYTGIRPGGIHSSDWNAVTKFQYLDRTAFDFLKSIQPTNDGNSVQSKMNWLIGQRDGSAPGRPYWTRGDSWNGNWSSFEFGTMVFGHQRFRVRTNPDGSLKTTWFLADRKSYDKSVIENIEFVEVEGFKPAHYNMPLDWLIENAYVQRATEAFGNNVINDYPRGYIFHPVWDPRHWPANTGYGLYIARKMIKE